MSRSWRFHVLTGVASILKTGCKRSLLETSFVRNDEMLLCTKSFSDNDE
jgi:hypothetical protein